MVNTQLLPIQVITPRRTDYVATTGGGSTTIFDQGATPSVRAALVSQLDNVASYFRKSFESSADIPGVAKLDLKKNARAKSHRPTGLFTADTCPIIGGGGFGELYVSVTPHGLHRVRSQIESSENRKLIANMTTLSRILPYTEEDVLDGISLDELESVALRLQLFRHASSRVNTAIDVAFRQLAKSVGATSVDSLDYAEGVRVFRVNDLDHQALTALASFAGTQSIAKFPEYRIVRTASRPLSDVSETSFPAPTHDGAYGLVGIIDSGTDPSNKCLQAWVTGRKDWVPHAQQDNAHGSFVAGLIVHGRRLNHDDDRFPAVSSKIVDVVAFDKTGAITEDQLLIVIDDALKRYPEVKVWNLSIALDEKPCSNKRFSLLAAHLDSRAQRYGVLFVVAAGNYRTKPFREWPPDSRRIREADRIRPPADGLRVLTVGSSAHIDNKTTVVRRDEPSPFTRRGPAAAYIIKPDLCANGGNCDRSGNFAQVGVISVDGLGHIAEDVGTSFACPQCASLAGNVYRELNVSDEEPSPLLIRGLMIHSAFLQNSPLDAKRVYYDGFGRPGNLDELLYCTQSSATLILHVPLHDDADFTKEFPMPTCLNVPNSGLRGEVFMTLVYDPPLDHNHGFEYARSNVNASLGTVSIDSKTGAESGYNREVHPTPKALTEGWEKDLIENGYKWSPTKLYYRKFTRGPTNKRWKLTLSLLYRSGVVTLSPQDVVLFVTVRDHVASGFVYDGMVREMQRLGWDMHDLPLRSRIRKRAR